VATAVPVHDAARFAEMVSAARASGRRALDEPSCKRLIASFGVTVPHGVVVRSADDVPRAAATLHAPWVVKVVSPDVVHKTDVGGVRANLTDERDVVATMNDMNERVRLRGGRVDGFLLEEMADEGVEVVIGAVRDAWLVRL